MEIHWKRVDKETISQKATGKVRGAPTWAFLAVDAWNQGAMHHGMPSNFLRNPARPCFGFNQARRSTNFLDHRSQPLAAELSGLTRPTHSQPSSATKNARPKMVSEPSFESLTKHLRWSGIVISVLFEKPVGIGQHERFSIAGSVRYASGGGYRHSIALARIRSGDPPPLA